MITTLEIWKDVKNYEGMYQVSNQGHVKSLSRMDGQGRQWKGRILKPKGRRYEKGYLNVALCNGVDTIYKEIHRLVLETFVGLCPKGLEACHNNGDSRDNRLENLRWDTSSNNSKDTILHGHNSSMKPIRRSDGVVYMSLQDASRALKADASNISKAALGKNKTAYGYTWRYLA